MHRVFGNVESIVYVHGSPYWIQLCACHYISIMFCLASFWPVWFQEQVFCGHEEEANCRLASVIDDIFQFDVGKLGRDQLNLLHRKISVLAVLSHSLGDPSDAAAVNETCGKAAPLPLHITTAALSPCSSLTSVSAGVEKSCTFSEVDGEIVFNTLVLVTGC